MPALELNRQREEARERCEADANVSTKEYYDDADELSSSGSDEKEEVYTERQLEHAAMRKAGMACLTAFFKALDNVPLVMRQAAALKRRRKERALLGGRVPPLCATREAAVDAACLDPEYWPDRFDLTTANGIMDSRRALLPQTHSGWATNAATTYLSDGGVGEIDGESSDDESVRSAYAKRRCGDSQSAGERELQAGLVNDLMLLLRDDPKEVSYARGSAADSELDGDVNSLCEQFGLANERSLIFNLWDDRCLGEAMAKEGIDKMSTLGKMASLERLQPSFYRYLNVSGRHGYTIGLFLGVRGILLDWVLPLSEAYVAGVSFFLADKSYFDHCAKDRREMLAYLEGTNRVAHLHLMRAPGESTALAKRAWICVFEHESECEYVARLSNEHVGDWSVNFRYQARVSRGLPWGPLDTAGRLDNLSTCGHVGGY